MSNNSKPYDAVKAIEELVKALNAGNYNAAPSTMAPGRALEIEPLDLTFDQNGNFWPTPKKDDRYPHVCPRCKGPAYVGFNNVDCKNKC